MFRLPPKPTNDFCLLSAAVGRSFFVYFVASGGFSFPDLGEAESKGEKLLVSFARSYVPLSP